MSTGELQNGPRMENAKKWTFVKQILMVHARGPCQRPRVDIAQVHAWTLCKVTSVGHPKKNVHYFEKTLTLGGFEPQSFAWKSSV